MGLGMSGIPMPTEKKPDSGLTPAERQIMDTLRVLHKSFMALEQQHPLERSEFLEALHRVQGLMALRAARKAYKDCWLTYRLDVNGKWEVVK